MPHVDGALLGAAWTAQGESRFARPVAAVTAFVRRAARALADRAGVAHAPHARRDAEARRIEAHCAAARDHADLERVQREFDRRDAGGARPW